MSETNPKEESVTQAQSNTSENFKATDAESIRNSSRKVALLTSEVSKMTLSESKKMNYIQRYVEWHQWQRINGALSTLNTSYYVAVDNKRDQRQGVLHLQEQFTELNNDYSKLYSEYENLYSLFEQRGQAILDLHTVLSEVCCHAESVAEKLRMIETVVRSSNSMEAALAISNPQPKVADNNFEALLGSPLPKVKFEEDK